MPECICQNAVAHLQRKFGGKGVERKIKNKTASATSLNQSLGMFHVEHVHHTQKVKV